jgi:hypothetical protein
MNVRTITLAVSLIVPAAAVFAAENIPYTGPNKPVMTTAENDVVTQEVYGWRHTAGKAPTLRATGDNAGFRVGSGYTGAAENVAILKDAPTNKENLGWQIIAGKDKTPATKYAPSNKTLEAAGKDKAFEAMKDMPTNTPTAN